MEFSDGITEPADVERELIAFPFRNRGVRLDRIVRLDRRVISDNSDSPTGETQPRRPLRLDLTTFAAVTLTTIAACLMIMAISGIIHVYECGLRETCLQ